jgi:hypothetical protein
MGYSERFVMIFRCHRQTVPGYDPVLNQVSGQLRAPAALPPGKEPLAHIG